MPSLTIDGVYENGHVELSERPAGIERARVKVEFLPVEEATNGQFEDDERQKAIERLFARMEKGYNLGGGPYYINRADLYDERNVAARRAAGERLLEQMRKGINFGGEKFNREELYEERLDI
jgi:hypothetical protein